MRLIIATVLLAIIMTTGYITIGNAIIDEINNKQCECEPQPPQPTLSSPTINNRPNNQDTLLDQALTAYNGSLLCRRAFIEQGPKAVDSPTCTLFLTASQRYFTNAYAMTDQIAKGKDPFDTALSELTEDELNLTQRLHFIIKGDIISLQRTIAIYQQEANNARQKHPQLSTPPISIPTLPDKG